MRRIIPITAIVLLGLLVLFGSGCIGQKSFPSTSVEQLASSNEIDLDNNGMTDYAIYDFSPSDMGNAGMRVHRQMTVAVETASLYASIKPNLTDADLLEADQKLEEFSKSRIQADTACSQELGVVQVVCSDITTCSKLCSAASGKCKRIAANYEEPVGGSIISLVRDNNEMSSLLLDARRMVLRLRTGTEEDRNAFLGKTRQIVKKVADINANPLYNSPELALCSYSDYGVMDAVDAASLIGTYSTDNISYHYTVMLLATPLNKDAQLGGDDIGGIGMVDRIPKTIVPQADHIISAQQQMVANDELTNVAVNWNSAKASKQGYLFVYEFNSNEPPETVLPAIKKPDLTIKTVNLAWLAPTNALFTFLNGQTGNYYMAMGMALGITLAFLFLLYSLVVLLLTTIGQGLAGLSITAAFRKVFGRTIVRWKSDIILAMIAMAGAYYVCVFMAVQPATPPPLVESIDFLLKNGMGLVGISLSFIATLMAYFAIENFIKITLLEHAYGMAIKHEKESYFARAETLREKIKELTALVEQYRGEEFDVSKEYDILTSISAQRIDELAREATPHNKVVVEEQMARVEHALGSLKERRKIAEDSWPKWKESITNLLSQSDEVYASSLVTIPASLRLWALGRYSREAQAEGILFERDAVRKKKLSPQQLVTDMIERSLIKGAIVVADEKIAVAECSEGGTTVKSALVLKMRTYLRTLAKELGQHDVASFAAVGDKKVMVFMKSRTSEAMIFMNRDKFKEAVEYWKLKMKMLE